mmetsp:Transcript_4297/g.4735  ORF Transcript_4297/g.4735 Transcript_4297/m.4735 type:complete len:281 (+) Transcript_4297:128-970(+)
MLYFQIGLGALFSVVGLPPVLGFQPAAVCLRTESSSSALFGVRNYGLEKRRYGAAPTDGGMELYLKAAEDDKSVGDCPFAHSVRMALNEKGLEYDLRPSVERTKPSWLIDHYEGKMPALRHRKECYVESDVIMRYIDFFFPEPALMTSKAKMNKAIDAVDGFFPEVARYLKHTPDGDDEDIELKNGLEIALQKIEDHLLCTKEKGDFLCGDIFTVHDCSLGPKLYHMKTGVKEFKDGAIDLEAQFPETTRYMNTIFSRKSFIDAIYSEDVIVWGWGNARE